MVLVIKGCKMFEKKLPPELINSVPSIHSSSHVNRWWAKLKKLFIKQPLLVNVEQVASFSQGYNSSAKTYQVDQKEFSFNEWLQNIDILIGLVQIIREKLQLTQADNTSLETVGLITYLFHIDRLLVKLKENLTQFRYRRDQLSNYANLLTQEEFTNTNQALFHCLERVKKLTTLLQIVPLKKLYSEELTIQLNSFELELTALTSALRMLNQFTFRHEATLQLSELEQDLFKPASKFTGHSKTSSFKSYKDYMVISPGVMYSVSDSLKESLKRLSKEEDVILLAKLIEIYETLKRCYVVARKLAINDALDRMSQHIQNIVDLFEAGVNDPKLLVTELQHIYRCFEIIRFNTHRDSRCSQALFEKAKKASKMLRRSCMNHSMGHVFLKEINLNYSVAVNNALKK